MNVYECYQVITSLCQFLQSEFHSEDLLRGPRAAQNPPLGSNCHQDQSSAPRRVLRIQYHHILLPGHQRPNYHHHHHHHQDFNFRAVLVRVCSFSIFTIPPFWVNRCTVETTPLKGRKLTFQAVLQMISNIIFRNLREELVVRKGEVENWKRCLKNLSRSLSAPFSELVMTISNYCSISWTVKLFKLKSH